MNKIELEIVALSHSVTQSHNYAVVLGEINGTRRLPIVIGGFEAQAIAVAMENMTPNRPLTHDLFKNTLDTFDIKLKEILVNNLQDGIFYAQLICESDGKIVKIDSRTSDAIAMAVRYECPIFTMDFIMEEAGVVLEESESGSRPGRRKKSKVEDPSDLTSYTKKSLKKLLDDVLAKEDYEQAAKIRDELNRRSTDQQ